MIQRNFNLLMKGIGIGLLIGIGIGLLIGFIIRLLFWFFGGISI